MGCKELYFYKYYDYEYKTIVNKNYPTIEIKDCNLEDLNIDFSLVKKLKQVQLNAISNLIYATNQYLEYFRFTDEEIENIYQILYSYFKTNDTNFDSLGIKSEEITVQSETNEVELIDDNKLADNTPIGKLDLPVRAINVLMNYNITTIGELLKLDKMKLYSMRNLGSTTIRVILKKLDNYKMLYKESDEKLEMVEKNFDPIFSDNTPIGELDLPVRAIKVLMNYNITTIGELLKLDKMKLYSMRNLGATTIREILKKLDNYKMLYKESDEKLEMVEKKFDPIVSDDNPIAILDLSVRANRVLQREGIDTISKLYNYDKIKLMNFEGLGIGSYEEIIKKLETYIKNLSQGEKSDFHKYYIFNKPEYFITENDVIKLGDSGKIVADINLDKLIFDQRSRNVFYRENIVKLSDLLNYKSVELLKIENYGKKCLKHVRDKVYNYIDENIRSQENYNKENISLSISNLIESKKFEGIRRSELILKTKELYDEEQIVETIDGLIEKNIIFEYEDDKLFYRYQSFPQFLYKLESSDIKDIMFSRIDGTTFEELAAKYNITRERIRQKQEKFLGRVAAYHIFREDRFKHLYETYYFTENEFCEIFKEKARTFNYLELRYKHGNLSYSFALEDESVPNRLKSCINKYLNRDFITIDDITFKKTTNNFIWFYSRKYCQEETTMEEFSKEIAELLDKYDIQKPDYLFNIRSLDGKISRLDYIITKTNRKLRYYDFNHYDFTELLEAINLNSYHNIQISTELFFIKFPDLMEKYNIKDKYELHNILRKIYEKLECKDIQFLRMPTIQIGEFDRMEYMKGVIKQLGRCTRAEIVDYICNETGISYNTLEAGWTAELTPFIIHNNGKNYYEVSNYILADQEKENLNRLFIEDIYSEKESLEMLQSLGYNDIYLLSQIGYKKVGQSMVKKTTTYTNILTNFILSKDIISRDEIREKQMDHSMFYEILNMLQKNYQIIEFEADKFINIARLNKFGYTKQDFMDYGDMIVNSLDDSIFTIEKVVKMNISSNIDELGFDSKFYESIIKFSNSFDYIYFNNKVIFVKKGKRLSRLALLEEILNVYEKMEMDELIEYLYINYGIETSALKIKEIIKDTTIYYDSIMETVYKNYNVYYEEI